jgi:SAM-dependent methyltransferase
MKDSVPLRELVTREPQRSVGDVLEFVNDEADYCSNFGKQWNLFRTVQVDSLTGSTESRHRFFAETGWTPSELAGRVVLDAGCGAGRFAEIALEAGARVVAVDLSEAAYACRRTIERFPSEKRLVLRADLDELPLREGSFDGIYSLGVLHHTPDPLSTLRGLVRFLAPGGRLAVWIYERPRPDVRWLQPRTWLRSLAASWSAGSKLRLATFVTAGCFPLGWTLSWLGRSGERLCHFLPYAARHHLARGNLRRQWTYSVLDTFDWYGPRYEQPQRAEDVMDALRSAGLVAVCRLPARGMAIVGEAAR